MTKRRLSNRELKQQLNAMDSIDNLLNNYNTTMEQTPVKVQPIQHSKQPIVNKFDQIKLTSHCKQRAKERFNKDGHDAVSYFRSLLKDAKEIGLQTAKDGSQSILYAHGRIGIYVSPDHKEIKTIIKQDTLTYEPIKVRVAELHAKEFRKLTRKEKAQEKRLEESILEVNLEIASLELRKHKSRSQSVKMACMARISALNMFIEDMKGELTQLKDMKRQIARSMISVV